MIYLLRVFFVISLFASVVSCSAPSHYESAGEYFDSSATTTKIKASLLEQLGSAAFAVKVKTYKDDVQLSGFVDNQVVKQKAGEIASRTSGVKSVQNAILVKRS
jgi:osmotically-inducible protein OsmY